MTTPQNLPTANTTANPPRRPLNWPLIVGLGAIGLARPLTNTVLDQAGIDLGPVIPLGWTALISLLWITVVGLTGVARPVLTLTLTGITYALFALLLSGILSPLLLGHLEGPLANPLALLPMLLTNALWGAIAGALALAIQHAREAGRAPGAGGR